jgi:hypothetical protein
MSSADAWIAALGEEATTLSPLAQSLAGLSLTSSVSGSSGEYGGVAKRANLLFFVDEHTSVRLCFGFVGSGARRFCLKPVKSDGFTCGVSKHGAKFEPKLCHFYLRSNDMTAFCEPCFSESIVPDEFKANIRTTAKTVEEWKQLFTDYLHDADGQAVVDVEAARFLFPDPLKFGLKTPKKIPLFEGEFPAVTIPSELLEIKEQATVLPVDQYWWEEDDSTSILPSPLFSFMKLLRAFLIKYDVWLSEPFDALALRADTIEGDLHKLKQLCDTLQLSIGRSSPLEGNDFPDLWSALEFLSNGANSPSEDLSSLKEMISALQSNIDKVAPLPDVCGALHKRVAETEKLLATHDLRFNTIHPILLSVKDLKTRFTTVEQRLSTIHVAPVSPTRATAASADPWLNQFGMTSQPGRPPAPVTPDATSRPSNFDAEARLNSIEHQLKSLEKRVVGDGIRIGRFLFQSREDLRVWLLSHLPSNRFGLFLDGVSIFDFLAQTHMDSQENMAHLYNSQKNGFDTIYESKIISSMQNLFPNLFGKSGADGMDTSKTLPGLQNSEKWNSDGVTGLQLQVERELPNVDLQFRNAIASTFEDYHEARDLALELLYRSKKFALDLCNFMTRDVDFWKHKGYSKKSAWELTCLSVRRIFEDIHVVRVVGRDSRDLKNPALTATQIIWATLRSHLVMDEYSRRNFVEHPSISAVIARHLASHHIRPDDTLEAKFRKLEETVSKVSARLDSVQSRLVILESRVSDEEDAKNDEPSPKRKGGGKLKYLKKTHADVAAEG